MYFYLLTKRRIILFIALLGVLGGFFALSQLEIKLYPDIAKPVVRVFISHPSYTTLDFVDAYQSVLDTAINTVEDVDIVETTSGNGRTFVIFRFDYGINSEDAKDEVQRAFDTIKSDLPEESDDYTVSYYSETVSELGMALFSTEVDEKALYELAKPLFDEYMTGIEGVESADIYNIETLQASITVDQEALFSYNLTIDDVVRTIRSEYKNISIGSLRTRATEYTLRVKKDIDTLFDIENIIISYTSGKTIFLKDIADIVIDVGLPRNLYQVNGERAIFISIIPTPEANLNSLSSDAHEAMEKILAELPDHVSFETSIDPATFITRSVNNVVQSALIGAFLAIFCIILLIGDARNSIIVAASLPLSVILNFILMKVFGISINLISLSGLALAVGMIVDASIVVMENIYRHLETDTQQDKSLHAFKKLLATSVSEVVPSIIGSTITSVCVFVPLSFTSQLTASILGDLAQTVVFTLSCSLIVAIFVVPFVAFYVFRKQKTLSITDNKKSKLKTFSDTLVAKLFSAYKSVLEKLLEKKRNGIIFIIASVTALLLCILVLFPQITKEIIAPPKSNIIVASIQNSDVEDQQAMAQGVAPIEDDIINNYPGIVQKVFTGTTTFRGTGYASIMITLDSSRSLDYMINSLTEKYVTEDPWTYSFMSWDPAEMPLPETYALSIRVEGPDRKQIFAIEDQIIDVINKTENYGRVWARPFTTFTSEIALYPRTQAFSLIPEYSVTRIVSMIQYAINGASVITMNVDGTETDIDLEYSDSTIQSIEDVQNFTLPYQGKTIPVKHFFDFEETQGISELFSIDGDEVYKVYANMRQGEPSRNQAIYEAEVKELVKEIELPQGYRIIFEDTQADINDAISSLIIALGLSIMLIYIVLGIQFNSLRIPLLILVTIPFGFIGVVLSLFAFKSTVSLNSMLGVILLGGIVVNNAIILIDFYLNVRPNHKHNKDAIMQAVQLRFRPIIITTATTILGMLPIAFAIGDGANVIQPLGIAVSGGLAFSTFFTLFMIPTLLSLFELKRIEE